MVSICMYNHLPCVQFELKDMKRRQEEEERRYAEAAAEKQKQMAPPADR